MVPPSSRCALRSPSAEPVEVSRSSASKSQLHICGTLLPQLSSKQTRRASNTWGGTCPGVGAIYLAELGRAADGREAGLSAMPAGRGAACGEQPLLTGSGLLLLTTDLTHIAGGLFQSDSEDLRQKKNRKRNFVKNDVAGIHMHLEVF